MKRTIILDCGCGQQCNNDITTVANMIYEISRVDSKQNEIIFKWQLFEQETVPFLKALDRDIFKFAFEHAKEFGYKTSSSVFDESSLKFLKSFNVPWIKISARKDMHEKLIPLVDNKLPLIVSVSEPEEMTILRKKYKLEDTIFLRCVPKYPATIKEYEHGWLTHELYFSISDHTIGTELYKIYRPTVWEKHYTLKHGTTHDPFGDEWYVTPEELEGIL